MLEWPLFSIWLPFIKRTNLSVPPIKPTRRGISLIIGLLTKGEEMIIIPAAVVMQLNERK